MISLLKPWSPSCSKHQRILVGQQGFAWPRCHLSVGANVAEKHGHGFVTFNSSQQWMCSDWAVMTVKQPPLPLAKLVPLQLVAAKIAAKPTAIKVVNSPRQ
jgi:hypothetical protein